MKTRHILMSIAAASLLASPMLMAQGQPQQGQQQGQQQQQQQPMPQQQEAPEVSDEQIEDFVDAYTAVQDVRKDYTEQMQNAEDQEEAQALQQEANEALESAITETGMEVEAYQEVAMAVNADEEVREKVTTMLDEREGGSDGNGS